MRWLAAIVLFVPSLLFANAPPVPLPEGKKIVDVQNTVALAPNVTGYVFVIEIFQQNQRTTVSLPRTREFASFNFERQPSFIGGNVSLLAIPESEAERYETKKELFAAIQAGKLSGVKSRWFAGRTYLDTSDSRSSVSDVHTITAIDDQGIHATIERDGKPYDPDSEKRPPLFWTQKRLTVLGLCLAAIACVAGIMWFGHRRKPK